MMLDDIETKSVVSGNGNEFNVSYTPDSDLSIGNHTVSLTGCDVFGIETCPPEWTFTVTAAYTIPYGDTTYTISGGPDRAAQFYVDDYLHIYVNGALVATVEQHGQCCPPSPPVTFRGPSGGTLRLIAEDMWGPPECGASGRANQLDALYLHKQGESVPITLLQTRINESSCLPRIQFFFDQSYTLP